MPAWRFLGHVEALLAGTALALMLLIPVLEIGLRPLFGRGIDNAPLLVQHLGLWLAMCGALVAERGQHLSTLGAGFAASRHPRVRQWAHGFAQLSSGLLSGMLAAASWTFVLSEMEAPRDLAYGLSSAMVVAIMPCGFFLLGCKLSLRFAGPLLPGHLMSNLAALLVPCLGFAFALVFDGDTLPLTGFALWLLLILLCGAPIFAVLGGLALALFWQAGQPLASVPLSHYQITVNPSLPALPLFTLAGVLFAKTGAAARLGTLLTALFGGGLRGTALAVAALCSCFTALSGGSGVTILALGGLLLPLLIRAGFPERRGISLVTSASALGVLLAPSVPLIMYAIIARVPINSMFLAGVLPAMLMVACLLLVGGYLRRTPLVTVDVRNPAKIELAPALWPALLAAKWELLAPVVALGSLVSGLATPTESAALTAAYALLTQALIHRELDGAALRHALVECAEIIGGIMLILGMALGLTNFLIDAGIPDAAIEAVQAVLPNRLSFLIALNLFLLLAGALMEIYAAIVVLVPLLLPVALSYGIDPLHFGVIFLANLEMGFLCPPAGMNIYFASAMFKQPIRQVAVAVLPAVGAIFVGSLIISLVPLLATGLPSLFR